MVSVLSLLSLTSSLLSIFLNSAVIWIVIIYSSKIGGYKWILVGYSSYEIFSALIVITVVPVHFIYDNTWIIFSGSAFVEGSKLAVYGTGFYCSVLLIWLIITLFLFTYRYLAVCQSQHLKALRKSSILKTFVFTLIGILLSYYFFCGIFFCRQAEVSQVMKEQLLVHYNITDITSHSYMLMRLVNNDGSNLAMGTLATVNHLFVGFTSIIVVIFCSTRIYLKFKTHTQGVEMVENIRRQRKLFRLLLIQSAVPLLSFTAPGILYITFPLWNPHTIFGYSAPILTVLMSLPKFIDPIATVLLISEYRNAIKGLLFGQKVSTGGLVITSRSSGSSSSRVQTISETKNRPISA